MLLGISHVQEATGRANSFALPAWKCQIVEGKSQKLFAKLLKGSGKYVVSVLSHGGVGQGRALRAAWPAVDRHAALH